MPMRARVILLIGFMIFFISFANAEIIVDNQPRESYNLGEMVDFSMTITSTNGIYDFLKMSLNCKNHIHALPPEEISLAVGGVAKIKKSIFLIEKFIGPALGDCNIKAWFEDSPQNIVFSDSFIIENLIDLELDIEGLEFNPGESIKVKGLATKSNQEFVNGFVELNLLITNFSGNKTYQGVIDDGDFLVNVPLPENIAAGEYSVIINAYEKDPLEVVTNKGGASFNIKVNQIPRSLEIFFENKEIQPGESLKVKAILHDQTGQSMSADAIISVKDDKNKVLEQLEKPTEEFLEYPIVYNQPPAEWTVVAISTKLSSEASFNIMEKEDINVEIINGTIIITNVGNVPYTKPVLVRIGGENVNINLSLEVDEVKKYSLSAPDGEYQIEIVAQGESRVSESMGLTGNAISVKEAVNFVSLAKYPFAWIFMTLILGFIAFVVFRKAYKKNFVGYVNENRTQNKDIVSPSGSVNKKNIIKTSNRAELSLSLSGEKQNTNVVCLNIKNFKEIKSPEDIKETLEKIKTAVEESKAYVYENEGNIFFIFSPVITRTFDNEKSALDLAQKIREIMEENNKIFRQKIEFGISLNHGDMISRKEGDVLKFMSFGNLIINSKRIASTSNSDVHIDDKMRDKLSPYTKLEKKNVQGRDILTVKEMRDDKKHGKFITEFVKRIEKTNSEGVKTDNLAPKSVSVLEEKPKQEEPKKEEEKPREDNSSEEKRE